MGVLSHSSGSDRESGAAWSVQLEQDTYSGGETIRGTALLTVHEPMTFAAATADISGMEVVTWVEERGVGDNDVAAASYSRKSEAMRATVVIASASGPLQSGTHTFAFEHALPESVPGAYQFKSDRVGEFTRVSADLRYSIRLSTSEACDNEGDRMPDVVRSFPITVLRSSKWRPRNVRALATTDNNSAHECGLSPPLERSISSELVESISTGENCSLSAIIDSVTHFPGDTIKVLCRVDRDPSASVDLTAMSLSLVEDLEIRVAADKKQATSKVVCKQHASLPVDSMDEQVLSLDLSSLRSGLAPSLNSCFVQWQYRLVVVCDAEDKRQRVSVEFPVAILA